MSETRPAEPNASTNASSRKSPVLAKTASALGVLLIVLLGVFLWPRPGNSKTAEAERVSSQNLRNIAQALISYAYTHDGLFPPNEDWPDRLIRTGMIPQEMLVSPASDGDNDEYIYLGGGTPTTFGAARILLYEDPDHFARGVNVAWSDAHTEWMKPDAFEARLARQQQEQKEQSP
jgi:hypothetical protein